MSGLRFEPEGPDACQFFCAKPSQPESFMRPSVEILPVCW